MTTHLGTLNTFSWMDLKTHDIPGTAAFFSAVLGWDFAVDEQDWRSATTATLDGQRIATVSDLANPIYPPGTPAHIAYYLAVQDVDRRAEAAMAHGARLILAPFDAGDQGRVATLIDPAGAAFSLWRPAERSGWNFAQAIASAPQRMVLACPDPGQAERFYRRMLDAPLPCADFVPAPGPAAVSTPQWELAVGAADLDQVADGVRAAGQASITRLEGAHKPYLRLRSPQGLTLLVGPVA
ncbi:VOC family protein [Streptosporangium saharense]|uniref:VOC family protein n=1 Tax=Streptosporangium saharense TaxID=1706840 RepID=UPI003441447B